MKAAGAKWYVVRTHPRAEVTAVAHLRRQGFEAYLPCYRKERRHARRREIISTPLFPHYCFVAIDVTCQRWHAIRSTLGVVQLIGGKVAPSAVRDEVISELMNREDEDGFIVMEPKPRFVAGEKVRLVDNIFSLCSAFYESMMDHERVAVLLNLMGRQVRVVINQAALAAE